MKVSQHTLITMTGQKVDSRVFAFLEGGNWGRNEPDGTDLVPKSNNCLHTVALDKTWS